MALATSLVSYWKLDNTSDSVGSNTLTNNNSVTFVAGKIGNCANFVSASSQYFTGSSLGISGSSARSVSFWYNMTSYANNQEFIGWGPLTSNNYWYVFTTSSGNINVSQYGSASLTTTNTFGTGSWIHVGVTYDGSGSLSSSSTKIYVNGVLQATNSPSNSAMNTTATPFAIGARSDGAADYVNGKMDEVGVWSRALSADEISQLFNSGRGNAYPLTDSPSLYGAVAYYKLDGNSNDAIGTNNGTDTSISYNNSYGKINQGILLNGSSTYITLGDFSSIINNGDFSVSCWIKVSSFAAQGIAVSFGTGGLTDNQINIGVTSGSKPFFGLYSDDLTGTTTLSTSTWYHLVVTYVYGSKLQTIYINGTSDSTRTSSGLPSVSSTTFIGKRASAYDFFNGNVDEISVWNKALSSGDVTTLYNSGNGLQYPFHAVYTLTATLGTFALTGYAAVMTRLRNLAAAVGSFALTGYNITVTRGKGIVASVGSFVLTGYNVVIKGPIVWVTSSKTATSWTDSSKNTTNWENSSKT